MSRGKSSVYKERAQLNLIVYEQLNFFNYKDEFVALVIQTPIQNEDAFNFDEFTTFSERVKKSTQETANKMENRLDAKITNVQSEIANVKSEITNVKNEISSMKDMMKEILN